MSTYLLISGGPDSVYLFHHYLKKKKKFTVIHFNHHLRGKESDAEQMFVEDLSRQHNVPCVVHNIRLVGTAGIQERAREERLRFCFEVAKQHSQHCHRERPAGAWRSSADKLRRFHQSLAMEETVLTGWIASSLEAPRNDTEQENAPAQFVTAHHADDVLETLVMRSRRGAGVKGLTGIRPRVTMTSPDGKTKIVMLRPLLHLTKKKIVDELRKKKIPFCVDSSNTNNKYFRNRVRADLKTWVVGANHYSPLFKQLLKSARLLQLVDDHFTEAFERADGAYHDFVPRTVWSTWSKEVQFRFFARRMQEKGFAQQVENRHFQIALQKRVLQLGPARFVQKKAGIHFRSQVPTLV